jgi:presenilin-like A22 family membrane protease
MKHTLKITLILLVVFLFTQVFGLATVTKYLVIEETAEGIAIVHEDTVIGPQPEIEDKSLSFIPISLAIFIGTLVLLILIRFKLRRFWKLWFLFAVWLSMSIAFGVYMQVRIALALAFVLALIKVFRPNMIVHNLTEIFVYTGITILILPFLNLISAIVLLIIISLYDMYAVWKSKHMVKMAKFQTKSKLFAGLMIGYGKAGKVKAVKKVKGKKEKGRVAILGGGDIAFPLIFSSVVLEFLIVGGVAKQFALLQTLIISVFATIALGWLFLKGKKDKYYPAMPFITAGCLVGFGLVLLL